MRYLLIFLLIKISFGYVLVVNSKADAEKMKKIGIECQYDKNDNFYVCSSSDNIGELKRIKDFLITRYNIDAYITSTNEKIVNSSKNTQNVSIPKTGYCIQVVSSKRPLDKYFDRYKNFPFARIEKINGFYVLRVGEGSYKEIKELNEKINGFVRRCDIIPSRIIKSNFSLNGLAVKKRNINKSYVDNNVDNDIENVLLQKGYTLEDMYNALNEGDLIKARKIAKYFINHRKNEKKAYEVLGIIAMKKGEWKKACEYLSKINSPLKTDACYTYNLKKGYSLLDTSPKKALGFFKKACLIKKSLDCEMGIGYSYLNMKDYKKAENIFYNLYKKHENNKNIIKGYVLALFNLKEYDKLEKLKNSLPKKYQNLLRSYEIEKEISLANSLIKEKKYKDAEKILLKLYRQSPSNIYVLLALGNLYLQTNNLDAAEDFYKNVLLLSPDNMYALNGLKAVFMKKRDYEKALYYANRLKSLGFEVKDMDKIKELLYYEKFNGAIKANNCKKAKKYISLINKKDANYYLLLGDFYSKCEKDKKEAYKYYVKAYEMDKNNIDVTLKFLYSLLNFDMFEQIKIVLSNKNAKNLSAKDKLKLKKFYEDLYAKFASYLFNEKKYKKALEAAKEGLKYGKSAGLYEIEGWSCYKLGKYRCALNAFLKAKSIKESDNVKYALAVTYIKLGNKKEAEKLLDEISNTENNKLKMNISKAYIELGEIKKAEMLFKKVEKPKPKIKKIKKIIIKENNATKKSENFFPSIFGSKNKKTYEIKTIVITKNEKSLKEYNELKNEIALIKSKYSDYVGLEYLKRKKSGTKGKDKLNLELIDLYAKHYINANKNIYFKLGVLNLNSLKPSSYYDIGSVDVNLTPKYGYDTTYKGILPKIGFYVEDDYILKGEVGTTPLGNNRVSPTLTFDLKIAKQKLNKIYALELKRDSVKDSILSYVGNKDPYTGKTWGRVVENMIRGIYKKTLYEDSFVYASLETSLINGKDVKTNYKIKGILYPNYYVGNKITNRDYLGLFALFSAYSRNENYFYYKEGGYFSPKYFLLLAPRYEGFYLKKRLGVKGFLMPGFALYKETSSEFTLNLDMGVSGKYLINDRFSFNFGFDLRYAKYYKDQYYMLGVEYYFDKKIKIFKDELNKQEKGITEIW